MMRSPATTATCWCRPHGTLAALRIALLFTIPASLNATPEIEARIAPRARVEAIYSAHRAAFADRQPTPIDQNVIRQTLKSEAFREQILETHFGVRITDELLLQELQRMRDTSRDPGRFDELWSALGSDASRFTDIVVRPILVDRLLATHYSESTFVARATQAAAIRLHRTTADKVATAGSIHRIAALADSAMHLTYHQYTPPPPANQEIELRATVATPMHSTGSSAYQSTASITMVSSPPPDARTLYQVGPLTETDSGYSFQVFRADDTDRLTPLGAFFVRPRPLDHWIHSLAAVANDTGETP